MPDLDSPDAILVFDRTPLARLVSCAAVFASAALLVDYVARKEGRVNVAFLLLLLLLFTGTVFSALLQYGDHIYISAAGLMYRNRLLPLLGGAEGWMRWEDVVEIREIRHRILILFSKDGRKLLVDAIVEYAMARREILRRAPHASLSGTLTQEERA